MRYGIIRAAALAGLVSLSLTAHAETHGTAEFQITRMAYSDADNLHVRVWGMQPMSYCPGNQNFAYVNEGDSGAKAKIAALIAAHAAGRAISLVVEPTVFTNGQLYCHILDFTVY
jgi:hypothetical protein